MDLLPNRKDLLQLIKQAAMEAYYASKPADIINGKVVSSSPLKIKISEKLILPDTCFTLARQVTTYTDNQGTRIDNSLKNGDLVLLFRLAGGQHFIVLDKVGG